MPAATFTLACASTRVPALGLRFRCKVFGFRVSSDGGRFKVTNVLQFQGYGVRGVLLKFTHPYSHKDR